MAEMFYYQTESNFSHLPNFSVRGNQFLALAILMILLGVMAIWFDVFTTLITVSLLGVLLILGGIVVLAHAIWTQQWRGFLLNLLIGLLYLGLGILLVSNPAIGAMSLTMLIAAFLIVSGLFRIIAASAMRFEHWGWYLLSGIVTLFLGVLIWLQWPATELFIIGLFVGIELIITGWTLMVLTSTSTNLAIRL